GGTSTTSSARRSSPPRPSGSVATERMTAAPARPYGAPRPDPLAALDIFSVLGEPVPELQGSKFVCRLTPNWESPSFSPVVLTPGVPLVLEDLLQVEGFFRRHPISNPALNPSPHFCFFDRGDAGEDASIRATCAAAGWAVEDDPLSLDFVQLPMPPVPAPGVHVTVVDAAREGLHPDYRGVIRRNFHADDGYLQLVEAAYRDAH